MDQYQRQLELEQAYTDRSVALGIQAMQTAIDEGRLADTGPGRKLVATACTLVAEALTLQLQNRMAGMGGKYQALMRNVDPYVMAVIGLRTCLSAAAQFHKGGQQLGRVVDTFVAIGEAVEAESVIASLDELHPVYLKRTTEYLKSTRTANTHHRVRTYLAAGDNVGLPHVGWSTEERTGVGKYVCTAVFETGLFEWADLILRNGKYTTKVVAPTEPLRDVLHEAVNYAKAIVKRPPMLVPPKPWTADDAGGYLTEWMRIRAPRIHLGSRITEDHRAWLTENLKKADALREAANKAQSTPYRVNAAVANLLRRAIQEGGVMGLPSRNPPPKPEFPHQEGWDKDQASPLELDAFAAWKERMRGYYTAETLRTGRLYAAAFAAQELLKFVGETLYFPTFLDWRGRLYFSPDLNPQSHDFVKAGLEFAEGVPLGERGLFWLKVHVATCAGFDKHDFPLRAQWTDDNMELIRHFISDPINTPAPDPDQCWVFYAGCRALLEALALPDPRQYVCHIPCAMDATCSGLQHWSAILRDPEGGRFTNLTDAQGDRKEDIYAEVARKAMQTACMRSEPFPVRSFWEHLGISRSMAKRPTMTYVYGAKLIGAADYVFSELPAEHAKPIVDEQGELLYGVQYLAMAGAKALRSGVAETVPAAARGMAYLQQLIRMNDTPVRWVAPTGMPIWMVYNQQKDKRLSINSMGITAVLYRAPTKLYDRIAATNGISPNFIHSYDAAHMHMTLNAFPGDLIPIHDSFAVHMANVDELHRVARSAFLRLYLDSNPLDTIQADNYPEEKPQKGSLRIQDVLDSRFFIC